MVWWYRTGYGVWGHGDPDIDLHLVYPILFSADRDHIDGLPMRASWDAKWLM
jgi:hypothetical protein